MIFGGELHQEVDGILSTLLPAERESVRPLVARTLAQVELAIRRGSCTSLVAWASRQGDRQGMKTALFVSCTAALRMVEKFEPSRFTMVDRLLLTARHLLSAPPRVLRKPA
jgi:hypothetical protein